MGLFLGNQLISPAELIKEGGSNSKFGITIDNFIGNVDSNGKLLSPDNINGITFTGVTEINYSAMKFAFPYHNMLGTVSFPDLTVIYDGGMESAFMGNAITSISFPSLTRVKNNGLSQTFYYNNIATLDLSSLSVVESYGMMTTFANNQITTLDLSSLTTVGDGGLNGTFQSNQLVNVTFPSLTHIGLNGLSFTLSNQLNPNDYSTTLQSVSFPALTSSSFDSGDETAFDYMLSSDDGVVVHFPSNLQSVIGNWQSVIDGFGGTNTTVLFDLSATE